MQSSQRMRVKKPFQNSNRKKRKRQKSNVNNLPKGVVYIQSTFNNTIVTITNLRGTVIAWSSAGQNGFKGARKSSGFAAKATAEVVARVTAAQGLDRVKVNIKGIGPGRKTAIRGMLRIFVILLVYLITVVDHLKNAVYKTHNYDSLSILY
jgi:small subunit ribosomal protein S11